MGITLPVPMDIPSMVSSVSDLLKTGINAAFPTAESRASAEAKMLEAQTASAVAMMQTSMSVMLADAQSEDPWTSRARPSFLYVMYIMILTCIPFSIVWAISPAVASNVAIGMQHWLAAIPDQLWTTMQIGFGLYTGSRGLEKMATTITKNRS